MPQGGAWVEVFVKMGGAIGQTGTLPEFVGRVIAIIHRLDDVEDKWVVAPGNASFTAEEIMAQVAFQEQYFKTEIRM